jgi:5-methylcytosine-specific restriction endonuclease McrA
VLLLLMPYRPEFTQAVRDAALRRARYRCESCGRKGDLELHHVGNRADRSGFNAEVLCSACHSARHSR